MKVNLQKTKKNIGLDQYVSSDKMIPEDWEEEFDKWFNHGTKKEPRFAYTSEVYSYSEVKSFIREEIQKAREEGKREMIEKIENWSDKEEKIQMNRIQKIGDEVKARLSGHATGVISRMVTDLKSTLRTKEENE